MTSGPPLSPVAPRRVGAGGLDVAAGGQGPGPDERGPVVLLGSRRLGLEGRGLQPPSLDAILVGAPAVYRQLCALLASLPRLRLGGDPGEHRDVHRIQGANHCDVVDDGRGSVGRVGDDRRHRFQGLGAQAGPTITDGEQLAVFDAVPGGQHGVPVKCGSGADRRSRCRVEIALVVQDVDRDSPWLGVLRVHHLRAEGDRGHGTGPSQGEGQQPAGEAGEGRGHAGVSGCTLESLLLLLATPIRGWELRGDSLLRWMAFQDGPRGGGRS